MRIELPDKARGIASNVRPRDDFLLCISNRVAKEEREDKVEPAAEEKNVSSFKIQLESSERSTFDESHVNS